MTTLLRTRAGLTYVLAALSAGALIAFAAVPQRAWAEDSRAQAALKTGAAADHWCSSIPPGFGHPPINATPLVLQVLQSSIEPVPATDGLIHLVYAALVLNVSRQPLQIVSVVPVDPLAGFSPTGRNLITDVQGRDVAGKVQLFATSPADTLPPDAAVPEPVPGFSTSVPAGNSGVMHFDVTYTAQDEVPSLLAHAITLASPDGGGPGTPVLTNPVPVGCLKLAVLHPPLVGHGWIAFMGCCTFAAYHRAFVSPINGLLQPGLQFAIDFHQAGPNNTCCNGPPQALRSWWSYDTPVLAAAPGVVVTIVDGLPDQDPVGTIKPGTVAEQTGNRIVQDIGGGRYVSYGHLKPGSIPATVRKGAHLRTGQLIGRVGNSGNSSAPHLHFQVQDTPVVEDSVGLPFVFDTQLLEGRTPEPVGDVTMPQTFDWINGRPVTIDRTGAGVQRGLMPERNGVFGYNLNLSR
jgi:Peptidase family M23